MNLGRDKIVTKIISRLEATRDGKGVVKVEGAWGSFARLLAAYISEKLNRPILYICPHIDDADKAADDLHTFTDKRIESLGAWEGEEDFADATDEVRADRLKLFFLISYRPSFPDSGNLIIPASIQSICQPIPKPQALQQSSLLLQSGRTVSPASVLGWLIDSGFERVERIDLPGQFARRGGIIDIYAPLTVDKVMSDKKQTGTSSEYARAIRIEFFGDSIESIREINLDTHLSTEQIESVNIISAVCGAAQEEREPFINILPQDCIIILEEPADCEEVANLFLERAEDASRLYGWSDIYKAIDKFTQLHICRFAAGGPDDFLKVDIQSVQRFQHKAASLWAGHKEALEELVTEAKNGKTVLLYCEAEAEINRVGEIVKEINKTIPNKFTLLPGFIHQGFVIKSLNTIVISHHELFGQYVLRRRRMPARATSPVDTLSDLQPGDYVVHAS